MTLEEHFKAGYELFGPEAMKIMDQFFSGEIDWETCIASVEEPVINYRIHRMLWDEMERTHPNMVKMTSKFADYLDKQTHIAWVLETDEFLDEGTIGQFESIHVEIDDTIENGYYELVYEGELK
jgi:hypothetical protein